MRVVLTSGMESIPAASSSAHCLWPCQSYAGRMAGEQAFRPVKVLPTEKILPPQLTQASDGGEVMKPIVSKSRAVAEIEYAYRECKGIHPAKL